MNKNVFAKTAPMGWNSYDYYDTTVTEDDILRNAQYMADNLKQFGWEYVVVDIEWFAHNAGSQRDEYQYIPFNKLEMDEYSRLIPDPNRFPSSANGAGFKPIADKIHEMGLKFGIHIMRGIPRIAAHNHTAILNSNVKANEVADASSICGWNPDMYGVKNTEAGQKYYDSIAELYASWGVDYIKCDDICDSWMYPDGHVIKFSGWHETKMLHDAIMKTGREIVLSLSPGPANIDKAWMYEKYANMWRITDDFWDNWDLLKNMFFRCEMWQNHVSMGNYPDCDMLPVGMLGKGFGHERKSNFTLDEARTMMSLWCIFGSPLMIGSELPLMDDDTISLLNNTDLLRLLDGSYTGMQIARNSDEAVWISVKKDNENEIRYIALFNLSDGERTVSLDLSKETFYINSSSYKDVWTKEIHNVEDKNIISHRIPAHGVKLVEL